MAQVRVRYLIKRDGADGEPPRYFWQPSSELRESGFRAVRVPDNWRDLADPTQIEAAAIAAAQTRNAELDRWRAGNGAGQKTPPAPLLMEQRTVKALIRAYTDSQDYRRLAPKTALEYRKSLGVIQEWCGEAPVRAMTTARFTRFYEAMHPKTPAKAHAVMRVARLLFAYGRRQGWRPDNPAEKLGLIGLEKHAVIWPREAVAAFVATADQMGRHSIGTAVALNEWLGQRGGDVLRLPRDLLNPRGLVIRQGKTGAGVALPIASVPHLVARVEAELNAQRSAGHAGVRLLICEATGAPWKDDFFRHEFARVRAAVARAHPRFAVDYLPAGADTGRADAFTVATRDLWFMHLRHTAVVREAEAGATNAEVAAITGHSLKTVDQILAHYLVRTAPQAASAFQKRMAREDIRSNL